jgi:hypothetical protein
MTAVTVHRPPLRTTPGHLMDDFRTFDERVEELLKKDIARHNTGQGTDTRLTDAQFLRWVGNRFVHTYRYSVNDPIVKRLGRIANAMEGK